MNAMIDRLARLRRRKLLRRRDGEYEARHPEVAGPFVARVEAAAARLVPGADTIVPRRRRGKKRRRGR